MKLPFSLTKSQLSSPSKVLAVKTAIFYSTVSFVCLLEKPLALCSSTTVIFLLLYSLHCQGQNTVSPLPLTAYSNELYDWYQHKFIPIPEGLGKIIQPAPWQAPKAAYQAVDLEEYLSILNHTLEVEVESSILIGPSINISIYIPDSARLDPDLLQWNLENYTLQDQNGQVIQLHPKAIPSLQDHWTTTKVEIEEGMHHFVARLYSCRFEMSNTEAIAYPLKGHVDFSLSYASGFDTLSFSKEEIGSSKTFQNKTIKLLDLEENIICYSMTPLDSLFTWDTLFFPLEQARAGDPTDSIACFIPNYLLEEEVSFVGLNSQEQPLQLTEEQTLTHILYTTPCPKPIYNLLKSTPSLSKQEFGTKIYSFLESSLQEKGGIELDVIVYKFLYPVQKVMFYAPSSSPKYRFRVDL